MFLEALCHEYMRCETVFAEVLPSIFSKWDSDGDGLLDWEDVAHMMRHMAVEVRARQLQAGVAATAVHTRACACAQLHTIMCMYV